LDEVIVKDERLAEWRGRPVYWMPEISRPAPQRETADEALEYERHCAALQAFLAANAQRRPVLYFGDGAHYKGYDLFLQFIASTPQACAVHAGRLCSETERSRIGIDIDGLRAQLTGQGRLLETNSYIHTQRLKELYFGAAPVYLTTHRLALSSSTSIQAAELGKPLLVPDRGLLGWRVRANGLGDVYRYGDLDDLRAKALALWGREPADFAAPARAFWERFSDAAIRDFFVERLVSA
jgi:hypothetical protein